MTKLLFVAGAGLLVTLGLAGCQGPHPYDTVPPTSITVAPAGSAAATGGGGAPGPGGGAMSTTTGPARG